ncbi:MULTISPECIES: hypothetical protein [Lysinibacillus]|uniref:Uncharacterized protein n=2 Tax=Lysinibacillus TaxID=400634 RepID=A0A2I0UXU4_9BACI|nr:MULTISPECIES: hypothetical protein [Lysinibacillus]MEE3809201.1 hypothetical protein [Lysinibacillus fusiformis]PKU50893.1 hypothetical protein CRI88_14515 [Lysinibacillus fusiformis]SCY13543.1 hypothetical protein SAMN02787078_00887 [Lysinibacillus sp. SG9]SDB11875.1 hypothetical protein SAMN02787079_00885 [Lysinibacillus sp. TC-37]SFS49222.1 hypothetical protein SAMN02787087_00889 [Lysinibacillus sp. SG55]
MINNKRALISSIVILGICMCLFFPYPSNEVMHAQSSFMSFPIQTQDGYVLLGIIGSILFIFAMILLARSINKYHLTTIVSVVLLYSFLPHFLIMAYQETLATGIMAISYKGDGNCDFEMVSKDLMNGDCTLVLHNRSNEAVSFDLVFLDSHFSKEDVRIPSLMNIAGPYHVTIEANREKLIHLKKLLDLSKVPHPIYGGGSSNVQVKLLDGNNERTL